MDAKPVTHVALGECTGINIVWTDECPPTPENCAKVAARITEMMDEFFRQQDAKMLTPREE